MDVSDLAVTRLAMNRGEGLNESKIESDRTVSQAGREWVESRIYVALTNGFTAREITRATGNARGTVYVTIHVIGVPEMSPADLKVAEEILQSFRFTE